MEKESVLCSTGLSLSPADNGTEGLGGGGNLCTAGHWADSCSPPAACQGTPSPRADN